VNDLLLWLAIAALFPLAAAGLCMMIVLTRRKLTGRWTIIEPVGPKQEPRLRPNDISQPDFNPYRTRMVAIDPEALVEVRTLQHDLKRLEEAVVRLQQVHPYTSSRRNWWPFGRTYAKVAKSR
jgi:hypothetical protein